MIIDMENEDFILSSGRTLYANRGIIGISPIRKEAFLIFDGYDGIFCNQDQPDDHEYGFPKLTPEEYSEIADYMIALWTERKKEFGL